MSERRMLDHTQKTLAAGRVLALIVLLPLLFSLPAAADPIYLSSSAGVGVNNLAPVNVRDSTGGAVSATSSDNSGPNGSSIAAGTASALAQVGALHTFATATADSTSNVHSGGLASFSGLEMMVTGPGTDPITVNFNYLIDGGITGAGFGPGANWSAVASLDVAEAQCATCSSQTVGGGTIGVNNFTTGTHVSDSFTVTPGTAFYLQMSLHTYDFNVTNATVTLDFSDTAGFVTGGPVFNLPTGYTATSINSDVISNNTFGAATAVPEPSSMILLFSGFGALVGLVPGRRRKS